MFRYICNVIMDTDVCLFKCNFTLWLFPSLTQNFDLLKKKLGQQKIHIHSPANPNTHMVVAVQK